MFIPSYLARSRHGVFYFRWPLAVATHPERKPSTLKISLHTRDPKKALRLSLILSNVGQVLASYGAVCGMKYEEVRRLLSAHFNQLLAQRKLQIAETGRLTQLDASILQSSLGLAQQAVADSGPLLPGGNDGEIINRFISKYDLNVEPGTAAYTHLCTETKRAYRDYCAAVLDYDRSLDSYEFPSHASACPTLKSITANASQVSIRELSNLYTKDSNLGGQWVKKTGHEKADHISLLTEILGEDTDIVAVSTLDAQKVKKILTRYPKNRRKNPATRGLALADALDCKGVQTINVQTINKYLQTYGTMFGWAKRNSYVSTNVFEGLAVRLGKKQQSKTARTAFSQNQVQIIMQELLYNSRGIVLKPYQKWGPLIALYSGARLNEIAQIHLTDIRQKDGIWCFDLNDDGETKNLKTDASRRCVPIHSRLLEYGLLEHVQRQYNCADRERSAFSYEDQLEFDTDESKIAYSN